MFRGFQVLACGFFLSSLLLAQPDRTAQPQPIAPFPSYTNPAEIVNSPTDLTQAPRRAEEDANRERAAVALPPEADLEFQDFVSSSLGYKLPIFGHELFQNVPSTFAPLDRVPVTPDYLIGPGDELLIRGWGQVSINYRTTVDRAGSIYLPKVGAIPVAGLRFDELNDHLKSAIGRVFKNFELSVSMGQLRSIQVFVVGQVKRPGVYTVSSLSTLVNALFASGGPSKRGSLRHIQLKRRGKVVSEFDVYDLIVNGDKSKDASLLPGDVIYVPPVGPLVALAGSVNIPGIFELKDHDKLIDVVRFAGGMTATAQEEQAVVERIVQHQFREAEKVALSPEGLYRELQDGDIVRFLHVSSRFEKTVTLLGNVAVPGRYPWHEGMRVKDLIPARDFLITDDYWKRQNRLAINRTDGSFALPEEQAGSPAEIKLTAESGHALGDPTLADRLGVAAAQRARQEELKRNIKRSSAEINWEYALVQRIDSNNLSPHLLPFNLAKAIEGDGDQNLLLRSGDVITIFSQADMLVPIAQQSKFVRLEGEFKTAGIYQVEGGETLRHLIARVGGFTDHAYLYGAEFTRDSAREDQQRRLDSYTSSLERSIERNAANPAQKESVEGQRRLLERLRQVRAEGRVVLELKPRANVLEEFPDLTLEDGDRLFVPPQPATVNVLGSVYNGNAFVYRPGKTVSDYLRLAGGATPDADKRHAFVIRANGSTVGNRGSMLASNFGSVHLMPGDSIVVPEKLDVGATLRGFRDWTQVISQFIIGAAAAKVLFP